MSRNFIVGMGLSLLAFTFLIPILFTPFDQAASWFQGIGSILAIIVAISLPFAIREHEKRLKIIETKELLMMEIDNIIHQMKRIKFIISRNPISVVPEIDFHFNKRKNEIIEFGVDVYRIVSSINANINRINISINQANSSLDSEFLSVMLDNINNGILYVSDMREELADIMNLHHTAPPSA